MVNGEGKSTEKTTSQPLAVNSCKIFRLAGTAVERILLVVTYMMYIYIYIYVYIQGVSKLMVQILGVGRYE